MTTGVAGPGEIDAGAIETRLRSSARSMIGTLILSVWIYLTFLTIVELPHLVLENALLIPDPSPWQILRTMSAPAVNAWLDSDEDNVLISSEGMSVASAVAVAIVAGLGTATRRAHAVGTAAQPHQADEQAKLVAIERSLLVQNAITMAVMGGLSVAIASRIAHGASGQTLLLPMALLVWLFAEAGTPQNLSFARPAREALHRRTTLRILERQDFTLRRWSLPAASRSAVAFCMLNSLAMILPGFALRSPWANLAIWLALTGVSGALLASLAFASQIGLASHRRWTGWFLAIATASIIALTVWVVPVTSTTSNVQFVLHGLWSATWVVVALGLLGWPQRSPTAALSTIAAWMSRQLNPQVRLRLAMPLGCAPDHPPSSGIEVVAKVDGKARKWRSDADGFFLLARAGQRVDLQIPTQSPLLFPGGSAAQNLRVVDARHQFQLVCSHCEDECK